MKGLLFVCGLLATTVSGHIQMVDPIPIRSPKSKDQSGKIDYSYTNPLSTDGSDYPCKGYADDPFKSVADYSPGQQYSLKLEGSATHNGGSCQIGLSYDKGKTFRVIHSMIGGCPLTKEYQFEIPQSAPSGEALLSWSWFNKVGNREMYMNCAQVTIGGGGGGGGGQKPSDNNKAISRRDGFDSLPEIFQANNGGPGKCRTIEGKDVNFPMPGPSTEGSAEGKGYECEGSARFLGGGGSGGNSPKGGENKGGDTKNGSNGGNNNNNNNGGSNGSSNNANNGAGNNGASTNAGGQTNNGSNNNGGGNKGGQNTSDGNNNNGGTTNGGGQSNKGPNTTTDKPDNSNNNDNVHHGPAQPPKKPNPPAPGTPAPKVARPFGDANKDTNTMRTDTTTDKDEVTHAWMAEAKGCKPNTVICAPDGQTWALCDRGNPVHMGNVAAGTACRHGAMQHSPMQHAA